MCKGLLGIRVDSLVSWQSENSTSWTLEFFISPKGSVSHSLKNKVHVLRSRTLSWMEFTAHNHTRPHVDARYLLTPSHALVI